MPKILYYNWVPFDNSKGLGGGVSVYIKNIIGEIIKHSEYSVYFLSSGYKYNPLRKETYIEKSENIYKDKCKSFEIINSPVIAPLGNLAWNIDKYLNDDVTVNIFKEFLKTYGHFDIVHIFNIGGFGQKTLELKKYFPDTKFIFDLHNYNSLCMNSYLFNHNESILCNDYCDGNKCIECYKNIKISKNLYPERVKLYWKGKPLHKYLYKLKHCFKNKYKNDYNLYYVDKYKNNKSTAELFKVFRENNVKYINENFDNIIAVSKRVKEVAAKYGINEGKILVSYIGTKFADKQKTPHKHNPDKRITLAYLGYANILKGYQFLINSLKTLPDEQANKLNLVFAAKGADKKQLEKTLSNFNSVEVHNGYTHNNLEQILEKVDIGIIPVLWEDNLPQVAIEMVSNGIPILCSNLGGASELSDTEEFKFSGSEDLLNKLSAIVENPDLLDKYWEFHKPLTTMRENFRNLDKIYKN